jgi:hypothetical protein
MAKPGTSTIEEKTSKWNTIFGKRILEGEIPDKVKKKYNNGTSDWIGKQQGDTRPLLYVSSIAGSGDWSEKEFDKLTGIRARCFSYAYCGVTSPLFHDKHGRYISWFLKRGQRIFLDSGAHSFHRILRSGKTLAHKFKIDKEDRKFFVEYLTTEFIKRYADYIKWSYANNKHYDFWVTLDAQKNCKVIYKITKQLEKMIGICPIPVYHGDDSLDWVKRYIDDGHKIIGVGIDSKRIKGKEARHRYYSELHELTEKFGMATHGFAVTGDRMLAYPWNSIDSATHIKAAAFGKILAIIPERQRICQVHISENYSEMTAYGNFTALSKDAKQGIIDNIELNGFNFDDVSKKLNSRIMYNARILQKAVELHTKNGFKLKGWEALV